MTLDVGNVWQPPAQPFYHIDQPTDLVWPVLPTWIMQRPQILHLQIYWSGLQGSILASPASAPYTCPLFPLWSNLSFGILILFYLGFTDTFECFLYMCVFLISNCCWPVPKSHHYVCDNWRAENKVPSITIYLTLFSLMHHPPIRANLWKPINCCLCLWKYFFKIVRWLRLPSRSWNNTLKEIHKYFRRKGS